MKKPIIISLSIILFTAIISIIITIIIVCNSSDYHKQNLELISYGYREKNSTVLHLGEYEVKDLRYGPWDNGEKYKMHFEVKSGEDFYNKVIKTNDAYVPELDYKEPAKGYISIGYMITENNIFYYEVWDDGARFEPCYGTMNFVYEYEGINVSRGDMYILGQFYSAITEDRLQKEPSDNEYFYRQAHMNWYFNITYNDYIKIYNYIDEDICKIEDDIVYLKGIFLDKDGNKHLTNNYYVAISNVDGIPTLSLI